MDESSLLLKTKRRVLPGTQIVVPSSRPELATSSVQTRSVTGWRSVKFGNLLGGSMWGTIWMNSCTGDSNLGRALQHCFPSTQEFNDCYSANRQMYINVRQGPGKSSYGSVSRNGYASASWSSYGDSSFIDEFVYVDKNGQLIGMRPSFGEGPTTNVVLL